MSGPAAKEMELPATGPDAEQPLSSAASGSAEREATYRWIAEELGPQLPEEFKTADLPTLMQRLYALASQI